MTTIPNTVVSTVNDSKGFSLTIYNQNFALVREQRQIDLNQGMNFVRYENVAEQIDPTSLSLKSLNAPNAVAVREQNYQYDLLNPTAILNKSVGKTIRFKQIKPDGQVEVLEGTLLNPPQATVTPTHYSSNEGAYYDTSASQWQGLVIRLQDGRVVLNPSGEMELNEMPEGLVANPSLLWKLDVGEVGTHTTEVSYLTNGVNWKADYVAVVNEDETRLDITGWVTLNNRSGATYENAQLQLVAGDVRRIQEPQAVPRRRQRNISNQLTAGAAPLFEEEAFFEYHLYTLQGTTTVRNNETKQMTLLCAADVPVRSKLVYDSGRQQWGWGQYSPGEGGDTQQSKVNVVLELHNSQENNMGIPLPKGKVRVYKADKRGNLQFLGEELIDHTPRDELARFYIGDSFDVVGDRKHTNRRKVSSSVTEDSFEISIRNRKDNRAEVWVVERFGGDCKILKSSHTYNKLDARTVEFPITVETGSEVKIIYSVRIIN